MCAILEHGNSQNGSYGRGALIAGALVAGFDCTIFTEIVAHVLIFFTV